MSSPPSPEPSRNHPMHISSQEDDLTNLSSFDSYPLHNSLGLDNIYDPLYSSGYSEDYTLADSSTALGNVDFASSQGPWPPSPQYSSNSLGLIGAPSALSESFETRPHDSYYSPPGHGHIYFAPSVPATPQTPVTATRLEHPPIRIFTESLPEFPPAEDPRSPLRLQRSPADASPSALLTPAHSSYMASSPSSIGSMPPYTPHSPYNNLYFPTPHIHRSSHSPLTPTGGSISPTALTFKEEQSPLPVQAAQQEHVVQRVLDYSYAIGYPFPSEPIPQPDYKPHTQSDRRRYVEQVDLEEPIFFWIHSPRGLGIPLKDAFSSRFVKLEGRDDPMFEGRGPSVSIRLNWPGYPPWSRQIPTRDFRSPPQPVTRAKLAKNVAKTVKRFIEDMENRELEDPSQAKWRVGRNAICLEDLILVGLQHVSMGSWQAHLRVVQRRH